MRTLYLMLEAHQYLVFDVRIPSERIGFEHRNTTPIRWACDLMLEAKVLDGL